MGRGDGSLATRRICCVVEYLGAAYAGFQRQPGKVTVQATLEKAIAGVTQEATRVIGSGRTDAGAHALHQVVAFSTSSALPAQTLQRAINAHLPSDVAVIEAREVGEDFHPRFDARSRTYRYLIWNRETRSPFWNGRAAHVARPLDEGLMDLAAQELLGSHDFGSFVPTALPGSHERQMHAARCWREEHLVVVELRATGFMRQMVRSIVGTLLLVGHGKIDVAALREIVSSRNRHLAGTTAPACGLYLYDVQYAAGTGSTTPQEME